jgi:hypothetical protein
LRQDTKERILTVGVTVLVIGGSVFMEGLSYYREGQTSTTQFGQASRGPNYAGGGSIAMIIGAAAIVLGMVRLVWGFISSQKAASGSSIPWISKRNREFEFCESHYTLAGPDG